MSPRCPGGPRVEPAVRALPRGAVTDPCRLLVLLPGAREAREVPIDGVSVLPGKRPVDVWNLEVDGEEHTYFVEGILVHNKSPDVGTGGSGGTSSGGTSSSSAAGTSTGAGDGGAGGAGGTGGRASEGGAGGTGGT